MLLEGGNAVIYGGGGSIGGAVARAFAREGARVCLAGVSMNVIAHPWTHGTPMGEMSADDYLAPVEVAARTTSSRRAPPPAT